jgi:hypothetical protein
VGVAQDHSRGIEYFTRSANYGNSLSHQRLGYLFYDGEFVATVGDIVRSSLPGTPSLSPGFTSIINDSLWTVTTSQAQGTITDGVSNSALTVGQVVYYNGGANQWALADADSVAFAAKTLGVVLNTVGAAGNNISVLLDGIYSTQYSDGTTSNPVWVSQTAGSVTGTVPTASGTTVRAVGYVLGTNGTWSTIRFQPDVTYFNNG